MTASNTALATSCVQATGLSFCSMMNGYKVIVPTSANLVSAAHAPRPSRPMRR
jgi:hypothetical protein